MLYLMGLCSTAERAEELAQRCSGMSWAAHAGERETAPYRGVFAVQTDDGDAATEVGDIGLYVMFRRTIKAPSGPAPEDRAIASFAMVRRDDLTHQEADTHWREVHGPVALRSHLAMCDYDQFSIVRSLHGPELDGLAMCAFPDRQTLSDKFFNDDAAKADVIADVAKFAHPKVSLPRVVLTQTR